MAALWWKSLVFGSHSLVPVDLGWCSILNQNTICMQFQNDLAHSQVSSSTSLSMLLLTGKCAYNEPLETLAEEGEPVSGSKWGAGEVLSWQLLQMVCPQLPPYTASSFVPRDGSDDVSQAWHVNASYLFNKILCSIWFCLSSSPCSVGLSSWPLMNMNKATPSSITFQDH